MIRLSHIETFLSVVDHGSFSRAADDLYVSQSAVSQQIRLLERELGVSLMRKCGRNFELTPAGEHLARHGRTLLSEATQIEQETIRLGKDHELSLRVGYLRASVRQELEKTIATFSRLYPEVRVEVVEGHHDELLGQLRTREIDLAECDIREQIPSNLRSLPLANFKCMVEVSILNPLATHNYVETSDLRHLTCIVVADHEQQKRESDWYMNQLGLSDNFYFTKSLDEARMLVIAGRGFMLAERVRADSPSDKTIVRIPLFANNNQITHEYRVVWRRDNSGYYIEEFASMLRKEFERDTGLSPLP
ncbi:LysR family transcriptional regulator [Olegusella massiliensis]|uniref:LysR family transcriptional regulator n=1 Tax=Olegusella massiliensis TaxID=1776381 RepID=UPI0023F635FC|nr:LysR family transcriptional regulator [Olegusella massiliensis]